MENGELNITFGRGGYEGKQDIDTTTTGAKDLIYIPPDSTKVMVQLSVSSTASVTIEASASIRADVVAGTAVWKEWAMGASTGGGVLQDSPIGPITAIRANVKTALAGVNAQVSVLAQRNV